jgi:protein tyrosine/serine phosphatase
MTMYLVSLYRRLTGTDDTTTAEEERLSRNLKGMVLNNEELERLGETLDGILDEVDRASSTNVSLPPEMKPHV